jgi:lipoprotein-releasing system permease protein
LSRLEVSVFVYSWVEENKGLFQVIQYQKVALFLVLMLIVLLAFFGMTGALVMLVAEKMREITILVSLGARKHSILMIFVVQGLLIGIAGTGIGMGLGLTTCWILDTFPVFEIPPGVYPGSDRVPVLVSKVDVGIIGVATFFTCLAATLFPAIKASNLHPVAGLRRA